MSHEETVGIIGSGPMGMGLARLLHGAGRTVRLGTGHPDAVKLRRLPPEVAVEDFRSAASADVVIMSVRHEPGRILLGELRGELAGKVVIDTMNAWIKEDYLAAEMFLHASEGTWIAGLLPDSKISRAYSHIDWDLLVPRATQDPGKWAAGYSADDLEATQVTEHIIRGTGYVPFRVGSLVQSGVLDPGGALWAQMFTPQQMAERLKNARPTTS